MSIEPRKHELAEVKKSDIVTSPPLSVSRANVHRYAEWESGYDGNGHYGPSFRWADVWWLDADKDADIGGEG